MLTQLILCGAHQPGVFYVHCSTAAHRIYPRYFSDHVGREHGYSMITLVAYERSDDLSAFLWSSLITFVCGLALVIRGRPEVAQLRPRDMYLLTTTSWVVVCAFAALPMVLIHHISYTDAFLKRCPASPPPARRF